MGLHRDPELRPMTDPDDPDDWRPGSLWAVVADDRAEMAVIVEQIAVGDAIPLHRHRIDEVLIYESGEAEVQVDDELYAVGPGDIVMVPAGAVHGTRNAGAGIVRFHAVFPTHRLDMEYVERNPAPGTEGDDPQPGIVWDARTGAVEPL
jgi:quercetin dioxygenase-like cupin family protein